MIHQAAFKRLGGV